MPNAAFTVPPPLREGDRLTSSQFLRRWEADPDLKHAELIGGVVFMPSPVGMPHGMLHGTMIAWLWLYKDSTPGCDCGSESTWVMSARDVPQPDAYMRILPAYGGQSDETGSYGAGAPELVVEVSGSTSSRDLGAKLDLYRRAGVREYLTVLLKPRQIVWRALSRGRYRELSAGADGWLRSLTFPGLWLDPEALWNPGKSIRVAVEKGLATPEHAAFARKLQSNRR